MPSTPDAPAAAQDGPRWLRGAWVGMPQTDGRGVRWELDRIEEGGRVLHWRSWGDSRKATTTVVPGHPDYPSDAAVLAWQRDERRRERAEWRR